MALSREEIRSELKKLVDPERVITDEQIKRIVMIDLESCRVFLVSILFLFQLPL